MRSRRILTCLFSICLISAACSSDETAQTHSFQIIEEDGIPVAITSGGPKYEGELFTYEPVLTLKEDPQNEASLLFRPGEFTMDEDGCFYVLDHGDSRIAVFDPGGNYIRSFGRKGQGPGEFTTLNDISVHDGIVSVFDTNSDRVTRFRTDGTLLDVVTVPASASDQRIHVMHVLGNGHLFLVKRVSLGPEGTEFTQYKAEVLDASHNTIWTAETHKVKTSIFTQMSNGVMLSFGLPFSSAPVIEYIRGQGILLSGGVDPELIWYNTDGTIKKKIRLGLVPTPFTTEDRTKIKTRYEEGLSAAKEANNERMIPIYEAQLNAFELPQNRPYWREVISDNAGCLWLLVPEHTVDREAAGGGYLFRVVSPEGEYLGNTRVTYSRGFNIVRGKLMVRWTPPEAESPELLICNIRPAVEGLKYP